MIVHGQLQYSFFEEMLVACLGEGFRIKELSCRYREIGFPGENLICKGKVTKKYIEGGEKLLECSLWIENSAGRITVTGTALAVFE